MALLAMSRGSGDEVPPSGCGWSRPRFSPNPLNFHDNRKKFIPTFRTARIMAAIALAGTRCAPGIGEGGGAGWAALR